MAAQGAESSSAASTSAPVTRVVKKESGPASSSAWVMHSRTWSAGATRPREAADGFIASLRLAASRGRVAPALQVRECITQAEELAGPDSFFTTLVTGAEVDAALDDSAPCAAIRTSLADGAGAARTAYAAIAAFLRDELAPQAPQDDAAGRERYARWSRYFLGAAVDLEETYTWGLAELARVVAEQEAVAAQIAGPGATVEQAITVLDAEPGRVLVGKDALH